MKESAKKVKAILAKYPDSGRDALIPILQDIQDELGYLPTSAIMQVGAHLALPSSKIYGVATFYNQFRFQPKGRNHITICRGTACHVKGSGKLLENAVATLKIKPGQTSRDKLFSLETVACMGACGLAPVITVNDEFNAKASPAKLNRLARCCKDEITQERENS